MNTTNSVSNKNTQEGINSRMRYVVSELCDLVDSLNVVCTDIQYLISDIDCVTQRMEDWLGVSLDGNDPFRYHDNRPPLTHLPPPSTLQSKSGRNRHSWSTATRSVEALALLQNDDDCQADFYESDFEKCLENIPPTKVSIPQRRILPTHLTASVVRNDRLSLPSPLDNNNSLHSNPVDSLHGSCSTSLVTSGRSDGSRNSLSSFVEEPSSQWSTMATNLDDYRNQNFTDSVMFASFVTASQRAKQSPNKVTTQPKQLPVMIAEKEGRDSSARRDYNDNHCSVSSVNLLTP